jgi:flagellar hook assembly protein FlgD
VPVEVRIYDGVGKLVRVLNLGVQDAGVYFTKDKAAYWDGRSNVGEKVASGVYYYTLRAGDFTATRKMVVVR